MRCLLAVVLVIIGAAYAFATPCIVSNPSAGVEYYIIFIDDVPYSGAAIDESFKADFGDISNGWHDICLAAVNQYGASMSYFTLFKETIKNKSYYSIYPVYGYENALGEKLFIIINNKAHKEVGN